MTPTSGTHTIYSTIPNGRTPEESWSVLRITLKSTSPHPLLFNQESYIQEWDSQAKATQAARITATLANRIYVPNTEGCIGPFISVIKRETLYQPVKINLTLQPNDTCHVQATPIALDSPNPILSYNTFEKAAETSRILAYFQEIPQEIHFFHPPI